MLLSRALAPALAFVLALSHGFAKEASGQVIGPHPRIFLSATGHRGITPATLRARCAPSDSPWARACRSAAPIPMPATGMLFRNSENPMIALALRYLLYDEEQVLQQLRELVGSLGGHNDLGSQHLQFVADLPKIRQLAVAYDWLYPALTRADRATMEAALRSHATWFLTHEPQDVFASDAYLQATGVALAGLALAADPNAPDGGISVTEDDARRYLGYANTRWRTVLLPALAYTRGWWHEGAGIFLREVARPTLQFAAAWTTATDEDLFASARDRGADFFNLWVRALSYGLRPDFRYSPFGDVTDEDLSSEGATRPVLDILAWGTGSSEAQSLGLEVSRRARVSRDYVGTESWHQLVFYDPVRPTAPGWQQLPTAAHFAPTAEDVVFMRSGWGDEDTWVSLSCGDWFSGHQRMEVGGLQVFRRAPLVVSTGYYDAFESPHWINWYAQHSAHASALSVTQPGEIFGNTRMMPNLNDGGQRPTFSVLGRNTLETYRANLVTGAQYDTGGITAFEHTGTHDYAACDATRAYNSVQFVSAGNRPKVREVTRQVVFVRPDVVIVFDRIEAIDPSYVKRFTLHSLSRAVLTEGSRFVISQGTARLVGQTLLPRGATRAVLEGYQIDGMSVPPSLEGMESRGARLEVNAPTGSVRDYFLHVLSTGDSVSQSRTPWSLIEDGDRVGVRVTPTEGERVYEVTFNRIGPVGGVFRLSDARGEDLYRGGLGAGGRYYPPSAPVLPRDAGGVDAGPVMDGAAAPDGGLTGEGTEGCGCRTSRKTLWNKALLGVFGIFATRSRRRTLTPAKGPT